MAALDGPETVSCHTVMKSRRATWAVAATALIAVSLLAVQGCAPADPQAHAAGSARHDLTFAAARAAYQTYITESNQAALRGDIVAGTSIVSDAAWEVAHAQYTALANAGHPVPTYAYGSPVFQVPENDGGYPRMFVAEVPRREVGPQPSAMVTTLMIFVQPGKGAPWKLDGTAALLPGEHLPAVAHDSDGYATALATEEQGLLLPPDVVGATQAAAVDEGPGAPAMQIVQAGQETTRLYAQQAAFAASRPRGVSYTWLMQGTTFLLLTLRTADGGAVVFYAMFLNTTSQHPDAKPGAPIPVPANFIPIVPPVQGTSGVHGVAANWTYEFAAYDPPGTAGKIAILAATGAPSYAHPW
jgi:hypothetical protein